MKSLRPASEVDRNGEYVDSSSCLFGHVTPRLTSTDAGVCPKRMQSEIHCSVLQMRMTISDCESGPLAAPAPLGVADTLYTPVPCADSGHLLLTQRPIFSPIHKPLSVTRHPPRRPTPTSRYRARFFAFRELLQSPVTQRRPFLTSVNGDYGKPQQVPLLVHCRDSD